MANDKAVEVGELELGDILRIVYRSPTPESLKGISLDAPQWRGQLPSQAFNTVGRID